ncbi:MAG: hypothetical protein H0W88_06635 [Parachlamydiaceae bacterium]|nr:hypothetical protein [Parachlamydiaceae bacterium]
MLKLERNCKNNDINLTVRSRECFWNSILIKAFILALAFHLGAILLFHIQPFKTSSSFLFAPINVQAPSKIENQVTLEEAKTPVNPDDFPLLALYQPTLPDVPLFLNSDFENSNSIQKIPEISFASFDTLEQQSFHRIPLTPSKDLVLTYTPIQMTVSGNLAKRQLIDNKNTPFLNSRLQKKQASHLEYYHTQYKVVIDATTGQIFWFDKIISSGQSKIDRFAEDLLQKLQFAADNNFEASNGMIDIMVTLDEANNFLEKNGVKVEL